MVIGASTEEPVIFALAVFDRQIVDAGDPPSHQALFVELPILVAIATKPVARIVVPFICKAYGYPVVAKRPDLLDQPIASSRIHLRVSRWAYRRARNAG